MRRTTVTTWSVNLILLVLLCSSAPAASRVIYVDDDATSPGDGSSWNSAYRFLQDALADANLSAKPIEIRVAQGIYKADQGKNQTPGDRNATFNLIDAVALKGGYAGLDAPDPNERNISGYQTILNGDLKDNDDVAAHYLAKNDNSYHIVTGSQTDPTAVLDGFNITAGYANASSDFGDAGGGMLNMYGSPTLRNCTFRNNTAGCGGGLYNDRGEPNLTACVFNANYCPYRCRGGAIGSIESDLVLTDCSFTANVVGGYGYGGAIYNDRGNISMTKCNFSNNVAGELSGLGGALYNGGGHGAGGEVVLIGCTFSQNKARTCGGAIYAHATNGPLTCDNCTFIANSSTGDYGAGGAICIWGGKITLTNSTFRANTATLDGGAIDVSRPEYFSADTCTFHANTSGKRGGAILHRVGPLTLTNCVFSGNLAASGAAMAANVYNAANDAYESARCILLNSTFAHNMATDGGALNFESYYCEPRSAGCHAGDPNSLVATVTNCILWDGANQIRTNEGATLTVRYSDIDGTWPGVGNIDADPCFAAPGYWDPNGTSDDPNADSWVDGDYHLKSEAGRWQPADNSQFTILNSQLSQGSWAQDAVTSPCIDAGDPMSPIGYEPFPNGGRINMGAYGGTAEASKSWFGGPVCETIIAGDINGDCKVDFTDFAILALHWLNDSTASQAE